MKIVVSLVGSSEQPELVWPQGWPVPREGESVALPGGDLLVVRTVAWCPRGGDPADPAEPYVYLVVGRHIGG